MQSERLVPEMALVLACCRWPASDARNAAVRGAAKGVDWSRVLVLARRHRVQGLVHRALATAAIAVPDREREALAGDARHVSAANLRLAAESLRLVRRLAAADVPAMIVKGSALAALAYRTLAVKMAWDIDLLVPADMIEQAADVLEAAGYQCTLPGPARAQLEPWHRFSKESVWRHAGSGINVELHGALVDSPAVLPGIDARGPAQSVAIGGGMTLPTLQSDALFAYLCVHGAASGWRRAKWLADIGALLGDGDPEEIRRLYGVSQRLGAARASGQALLLCHRYLALPVPPDLVARLRGDRWTRATTALAARLMTAPDGFDSPEETALGTLPIHLLQMTILPGWRFAAGELRRKLVPDPRVAGTLSRSGRWLHPATTLLRRLRRANARGG